MFGDVGEPELVRPCRGEVAEHKIVMHRWSRFSVQAALLRNHRPELLFRAQPPHAPLGRCQPGLRFDLVGDEPIPERRVVAVKIDGRVCEVSVVPVALRDGVRTPLEECLLAEAQHPAGHRDRNSVSGQFTDQREHHLGSDACDR